MIGGFANRLLVPPAAPPPTLPGVCSADVEESNADGTHGVHTDLHLHSDSVQRGRAPQLVTPGEFVSVPGYAQQG